MPGLPLPTSSRHQADLEPPKWFGFWDIGLALGSGRGTKNVVWCGPADLHIGSRSTFITRRV